jgi:hypothetical protein
MVDVARKINARKHCGIIFIQPVTFRNRNWSNGMAAQAVKIPIKMQEMPGTGIEPVQPRGPRDFKCNNLLNRSHLQYVDSQREPLFNTISPAYCNIGLLIKTTHYVQGYGHKMGPEKEAERG